MANVLNALTLKDTKTGKTTDYEIQDTGARAQIAAQVAANTDENADYAAEVVDARVGADGESYASLGEAMRRQREKSKEESEQLQSSLISTCTKLNLIFSRNLMNEFGEVIISTTRCQTTQGYNSNEVFYVEPKAGYKTQVFVFDIATLSVLGYWNQSQKDFRVSGWDENPIYIEEITKLYPNSLVFISVAKTDNSEITVNDGMNGVNVFFKQKIISSEYNCYNLTKYENIVFNNAERNYIDNLVFICKCTLHDNGESIGRVIFGSIAAPYRAVTNQLYYTDVDLEFELNDYSNYQNNLYLYNKDGNFLSRTGFKGSKLSIPKGYGFRIILRTKSNDEITEDILSSILRGSTLKPTSFLPDYYTKEQVNKILQDLNPEFSLSKIMDFSNSSVNSATQQSVATDNDNIYILFPSDSGTKISDICVYNKGGVLIKHTSNIPIGHASNTAYYNGYLYIVRFKQLSQTLNIVKVNISDGTYMSINVAMSETLVWDGFSIYGGYGYVIGYDKTAHVTKSQPTKIKVDIISLDDFSVLKSISLDLPTHTHYTTQGVGVYENKLFAITSSADSSQAFMQGMNIDIYNLLNGSVETINYTSEEFQEPEGCFILDGYVCTSLVNCGGIYRIHKL